MPAKTLSERFAQLVPWLEKDDWAPLTYMLIPSVLKEAEALRIDLISAAGAESKAERQRMRKALRQIMAARQKRVKARKGKR